MKCVICSKEIPKDPYSGWDGGNNAEPVKEGRCCHSCNLQVVIPARLKEMMRR